MLILALLVVLLGVSGFFGLKLYSEAKQVKAHEEQAMQLLGGVTDLGNLDNLDTVRQQISQAKTETAAANEIAHGTLWNIASKAPVYGDDITTVQGMTSVVDSLVSDSVPQFMNVLSTLKSAQLSSGDGQLNLQPILEAQKNIATANQSLQQQVQKYQQLPKAHIGMVKNAYATGNTQLTKMADKVNQLSGTFQILPDFLGSDQPRTYALMAMTTSEERSSGGLIGSVGVVTTDNGKIGIGDFRSNGEYIPYGAGDPTEDEQRIFRQWGPLNMSFDVRDLAVYPDTSRSAEGMRAIWQRTPWGSNTQLDGVLMVDPVFLQELTKIGAELENSLEVSERVEHEFEWYTVSRIAAERLSPDKAKEIQWNRPYRGSYPGRWRPFMPFLPENLKLSPSGLCIKDNRLILSLRETVPFSSLKCSNTFESNMAQIQELVNR